MNTFKSISVNLPHNEDISCHFEEHSTESVLKISISGTCNYGSQGANYGQYLYQIIGLALLQIQPIAVLVDLQHLKYSYGECILNLFQFFEDVNPLKDEIILAFVLSNNNLSGLSSLLKLNSNNLKPPFFTNLEVASNYLWRLYNTI